MKRLAAGCLAFLLSGCAGTSVTDVANALKGDTASVCVHVENAYPPFNNSFTLVRSGADGSAVSGTPNCALLQGGTPVTAPTTVAVPGQPATVKAQ